MCKHRISWSGGRSRSEMERGSKGEEQGAMEKVWPWGLEQQTMFFLLPKARERRWERGGD